MIRTLLAASFVLLLYGVGYGASCGGSCITVDADVLPRLGIQRPVPCQCSGEVPTNANWEYLDAVACTLDHPCGTVTTEPTVVENVVAGDDGIEFLLPYEVTTLFAVACHCDANCGTPATLTFTDRAGNTVDLTGGGNLTCGVQTTSDGPTPTTFATADGDRVLQIGRGLNFSVTNSPTASQRITIALTYQRGEFTNTTTSSTTSTSTSTVTTTT